MEKVCKVMKHKKRQSLQKIEEKKSYPKTGYFFTKTTYNQEFNPLRGGGIRA